MADQVSRPSSRSPFPMQSKINDPKSKIAELCTRLQHTRKMPAMKSYDVIRQAVEERGVKAVAAALKVSPALVYKWCEPPSEAGDPDQSGTKNPLDRVREIYQLTRDIRVVRWLCNEAGGFFVPDPEVP